MVKTVFQTPPTTMTTVQQRRSVARPCPADRRGVRSLCAGYVGRRARTAFSRQPIGEAAASSACHGHEFFFLRIFYSSRILFAYRRGAFFFLNFVEKKQSKKNGRIRLYYNTRTLQKNTRRPVISIKNNIFFNIIIIIISEIIKLNLLNY